MGPDESRKSQDTSADSLKQSDVKRISSLLNQLVTSGPEHAALNNNGLEEGMVGISASVPTEMELEIGRLKLYPRSVVQSQDLLKPAMDNMLNA